MWQNSQETPVPEETPLNLAKFLKTPLLQKNSERLFLKWGHFNNEARGKHLTIQFLRKSARLLATDNSLI